MLYYGVDFLYYGVDFLYYGVGLGTVRGRSRDGPGTPPLLGDSLEMVRVAVVLVVVRMAVAVAAVVVAVPHLRRHWEQEAQSLGRNNM